MAVNFENSKTKINLMRAFAGECQARTRYDLASQQAKKQKLYVLADLFKFTANQEKEHAQVFYDHLKCAAGENIPVEPACYPVDIADDMVKLLRMAEHNESEEAGTVYPDFARTAKDESFPEIASSFENIGKIEEKHQTRFKVFSDLLEQGKLFEEQQQTAWMCLNCGYIFEGTSAPQVCPACKHPQGYYIRLSMTPWGL